MKHSFLLCLVTIILSSCATTTQVTKQASMKSDLTSAYGGKTHNYIVSIWGAPDRETSDGNGGKILIYENTTVRTIATAENINYYNRTYTPGTQTTTSTDYVQFFIGRDGLCYNVNTNLMKTWTETEELSKEDKRSVNFFYGSMGFLGITLLLAAILGGA